MMFASWGPLVSFLGARVELGSRFESAAPGIWHLAFAPGICIALQLALHLAFDILHLSFGGGGREMKRLGKSRKDAMLRYVLLCRAMLCYVVRCYRPL